MGSVKNTTDLIALPAAQCSRCRMGMVVTQFFCCLQDLGPRLFAHMVYTCAIQHIRNRRPRNACFACNVETGGRYLIGNILFLRSHTFSRYKSGPNVPGILFPCLSSNGLFRCCFYLTALWHSVYTVVKLMLHV